MTSMHYRSTSQRKDNTAWQDLRTLLTSQPLAVLSTEGEGQPYASLVAYAVTEDLKAILFATTRATRKYRNLAGNPRVSLLIDNRSNTEEDFHGAMAATVLGAAREDPEGGASGLCSMFLARHPHLQEFLASPTCAFLRVDVGSYYLVRRFQEVLEITP